MPSIDAARGRQTRGTAWDGTAATTLALPLRDPRPPLLAVRPPLIRHDAALATWSSSYYGCCSTTVQACDDTDMAVRSPRDAIHTANPPLSALLWRCPSPVELVVFHTTHAIDRCRVAVMCARTRQYGTAPLRQSESQQAGASLLASSTDGTARAPSTHVQPACMPSTTRVEIENSLIVLFRNVLQISTAHPCTAAPLHNTRRRLFTPPHPPSSPPTQSS